MIPSAMVTQCTTNNAKGSALVALLVVLALTITVNLGEYAETSKYGNQQAAFILATVIHIVGVSILLLDAHKESEDGDDKHPDKDSGEPRKEYMAPLSLLDIPTAGILPPPNISDITSADSQEMPSEILPPHPPSNDAIKKEKEESFQDETESESRYISMASKSTAFGHSESYDDDHDDPHRGFPCLLGFHLSISCFVVLSLVLSTALFVLSLEQQMMDSSSYGDATTGILRAIFVATYGFFLAGALLWYYYSYIIMESFEELPMLHNQHFILVIAIIMGVMALILSSEARADQNYTELQLDSVFGANSTSRQYTDFMGEAWVTSASLVDEDSSCSDKTDSIPIDVTVIYGGDWACPQNPDVYCEVVLSSQLECDDPDGGLADGAMTLEEYVYFRYHDYGVDDDGAYDLTEEPSFEYWNRPTESIVGSCDGTCEAQSERWISSHFRSYSQSTHAMYLFAGIGICFLGWPLYSTLRFFLAFAT